MTTREELSEHAVGVMLFAAIAVGVGGMAARHLGREMWLMGVVVAVYVTICFAAVIAVDIGIEGLMSWWAERRRQRSDGPLSAVGG